MPTSTYPHTHMHVCTARGWLAFMHALDLQQTWADKSSWKTFLNTQAICPGTNPGFCAHLAGRSLFVHALQY
eukprot:1140020-Pelagomonas_calceolata.AAC.4